MKMFNRRDRKDVRRKLRNELTEAEKILWLHLRGRGFSGFKFRRQHSVGPFVVDFYCPQARLVIEIDGDSHFEPLAEQRDQTRQSFIESQDLRVIRFTNIDVQQNIESVLEAIREVLPATPSSHPTQPPLGQGRSSKDVGRGSLPKIVIVVGPTASGKTALGKELAEKFNGEIISVDSRQIYRGMDIGTAKPSVSANLRPWSASEPLEVDGVPHWGIDLVDPDQEYSVAEFKTYAEEKIAEILQRKKLPILVGGTGLWVSAIVDNLEIPEVPPNQALRAELEKKSLEDLVREYEKLDPRGAEIIDRDNPRRLIRALEVTKSTGTPFSELQRKGEPKYEVLQIGLDVPRKELYQRIDKRVDAMVARGLVDEVRGLKEKYGCNIPAMSGIGYRQICAFLEGKETLPAAVAEVKKATRQYAKRQLTWFKRDSRVRWVANAEAAIPIVEQFVQER
jgi:tRNA dimethylallyltransferase